MTRDVLLARLGPGLGPGWLPPRHENHERAVAHIYDTCEVYIGGVRMSESEMAHVIQPKDIFDHVTGADFRVREFTFEAVKWTPR